MATANDPDAPTTAVLRPRALTAIVWLAAGGIAVAGVVRAVVVDARELAASMQDDSFYYMLSTWRAAHADGVLSFDGEHATYGMQPGFAAVLMLLALPFADRETFFRVAMAFAVVLHAGTALLLQRTVAILLQRAGAVPGQIAAGGALAAGAWLANLPVAFGSTTLKENVFYAPLLVLAWAMALPAGRRPAMARLGALLALSVACRLTPSTVLTAAVLALAALGQHDGLRARARATVRLGLGGLLGATPFFYGVLVMGRLMPTCGAVKLVPLLAGLRDGSYWRQLPDHLAALPTYLVACLQYATGLPHGYFSVPQSPQPSHAMGFVLAPLAGLGLLWLWRRASPQRAPARLATCLLAAALLGKAANFLMLSPWGDLSYMQWYVAGLPVLAMGLCGFAVGWLPIRAARWLAGLVLLAAVGQAIAAYLAMPTRFHTDPHSWQRQMLATTAVANGMLPGGARIAASNSGALGYFARADLVVVNVDGLANDDWFVATHSGCSMWDYLEREHIPYLCDVLPRYGWRENPFDSVRPLAVLPFAGTDYDGYYLLERQPARFPNFWPMIGVGSRRATVDSPVMTVPWLPPEALPAWSPPGALPGRGGSWANWRFDGPTRGAGLRFHLGGAYESLAAFVGGRSGVLDVRADGRTVAAVPCAANAWSPLTLPTADAGELVFEFEPSGDTSSTGGASEQSPLWLASCQWRERTAAVVPQIAGCEPFGSGCAERGEIPQLTAVGGVAPGRELRLRIRAAPRLQGMVWITIGAAASRLSPIGAVRPCYSWCGPEVVTVAPFVAGDDGVAVVAWTIPTTTPGRRYVAQALLGKDTPDAAFSNGLRIDVP